MLFENQNKLSKIIIFLGITSLFFIFFPYIRIIFSSKQTDIQPHALVSSLAFILSMFLMNFKKLKNIKFPFYSFMLFFYFYIHLVSQLF